MRTLAICRAQQLPEQSEETRWLIEGLWAQQGVGIIGGEPKCCKSFLALDLAVSVAASARCLGRFAARQSGRVLLFAAEDSLPMVRQRLQGIARARCVDFDALDLHIITEAVVRLDREEDRTALETAIRTLQPRVLVLDPLVRLHTCDENQAQEMAPLLAFLRHLQRTYGLAVVLVHHSRKGGGHLRAGQALRGSSELHAWGDSNLYLRRQGRQLTLTVEHRGAPSPEPLALELAEAATGPALQLLQVAGELSPTAPSAVERICKALESSSTPLSLRQLRARCRMRTESLSAELAALVNAGRLDKGHAGYRIRAPDGQQLRLPESLTPGEPPDLRGS